MPLKKTGKVPETKASVRENTTAADPAADSVFRPEDIALIREFHELARKHGYGSNEAGIKIKSPVYLEKGESEALVSITLEVYRWGEDPFGPRASGGRKESKGGKRQ